MALLLTIPLQANVYIGELPVATKKHTQSALAASGSALHNFYVYLINCRLFVHICQAMGSLPDFHPHGFVVPAS